MRGSHGGRVEENLTLTDLLLAFVLALGLALAVGCFHLRLRLRRARLDPRSVRDLAG